MRSVSYRLADFENKKLVIPIGFVGENEFTKVNIDCQRVFKDHPSAVATLSVVPPSGDDYPAIVTRDGDIVTWEVTASDLVYDGFGEIQLTFTDGTKIGKDYKARTHTEDSIAGSGTAPTPVQNWIDSANEKLAAVEEATQEAEDAASHPPRVGSTGYWEIWDVETEQYVATSTKAQGEDGDPGHSPVITANKNGKTTVLYSDGQQIAQIVDGNDGSPGDPTTLIDDTAGTGVTNKTLSADKITTEFGSVKTAIQGKTPYVNENTYGEKALIIDGADDQPLTHLKVQINPQQAGSGTPAPNNVRAISGLTGVTISKSGENTTDPTTVSVSWQTEAGTVYYGEIDVITGSLTVLAKQYTFDGSEDEKWYENSPLYNQYTKYRYYSRGLTEEDVEIGAYKQSVVACNWLRPTQNGQHSVASSESGTNFVDMHTSNKWLFCAVEDYTTKTAFLSALASNPLVVIIKLATPLTYQIADKATIKTLFGINNIWSNSGDVLQCEYKADTKLFAKKVSGKVNPQITEKADTLTDGTITAIENVAIRKNLDIDFKASITDFTSLTIGHGFNMEAAAYIVIDDTNVTVYANEGTQRTQYAHGLTISNYIHVLIQQDDESMAKVLISTLSGSNTNEVAFVGCRGDVFATVDGTLTGVTLSAVIKDLNKKIWVCGDSYQSLTDSPDRWPTYLKNNGFIDHCMFIGHFGATAYQVMPSVRKLLTMQHPDILFWCLGVNNKDENSEINVNWQVCVNELISLCEMADVELVFQTIPNTPNRKQTYKNTFIKNSGYRYVDVAKALGAETVDSTWYEGMLASDNLHPSTTGALAMYGQILADLPELME